MESQVDERIDGWMITIVCCNNIKLRDVFIIGQITQEESLFSYPMGQGVANFSDPNHEPQFLDELDNKTRQEAEAVCGGSENIQCIFDFSQTGNKELALDTQRTLNTSEENQRIAGN